MKLPNGALTAIITPFFDDTGRDIDWKGFKSLINFQIAQGIAGIVPAGTTGESPTLSESDHREMIFRSLVPACPVFVLLGCGSNSTKEAMEYVKFVANCRGEAVLLNDPYYNGPSSLEIRKEYYEPIAKAFPEIAIVPYIIPGRTGCMLSPQDLAILNSSFPNVCAVKEATGDMENMKVTRNLLPFRFKIFSGDDDKTYDMMVSDAISASGVISVISNIAPAAVQKMCQLVFNGELRSANELRNKLKPLFEIVTVSAERRTTSGNVIDKFRNPLAIKTAMNALGMPAGPCRQPLGKMSVEGVQKVREALFTVYEQSPEIFSPIANFFGVNIQERLYSNQLWASLSYLK